MRTYWAVCVNVELYRQPGTILWKTPTSLRDWHRDVARLHRTCAGVPLRDLPSREAAERILRLCVVTSQLATLHVYEYRLLAL
jgi:hypothetical protein